MALTWDLSKIEDMETVCFRVDDDGDRALTVETHCLIWATMGVGLGRITHANAEEFAARLEILQDLNGAMMGNAEGPVRLTREDVLRNVGLRCNVTDETRAAWLTRITKSKFQKADHAKATAQRDARIAKARAAGHSVF